MEKQWLKVRSDLVYLGNEFNQPIKKAFKPNMAYYHRVKASTFLDPMVVSGHLKRSQLGVALPDPSVMNKIIQVYLPETNKVVRVPVIDIGPHDVRDAYWFEDRGPKTDFNNLDNQDRLGIALTPATWEKLGIAKEHAFKLDFNHVVYWRFYNNQELEEEYRIKNALYPPNSPFIKNNLKP